jgi:hypothetical protein
MSYMNGGGEGLSQGYYMNSLTYRFDAPVLLRLRTGVTNNPFAQSGGMGSPGESALSQLFSEAEFFGGADLLWKPRDNMAIQISVDRMPGNMLMGYPGMMGYGYRGPWDYYGTSYGWDRFGGGFGTGMEGISAER